MTPLLTAVKYDMYEAFCLFFELGANLNVACTQFNNPLHYAVLNKNQRLVERIMLLDSDENVLLDQQNCRAKTPLELDNKKLFRDCLKSVWNFA